MLEFIFGSLRVAAILTWYILMSPFYLLLGIFDSIQKIKFLEDHQIWQNSILKTAPHWEEVKYISDQSILKDIVLKFTGYQSHDYRRIAFNKINDVTWLKKLQEGKINHPYFNLSENEDMIKRRLDSFGNSLKFILEN